MLFEPTTLAATATAIAEAVKPYGCDPNTLFQRAGLDMDAMQKPGARYPLSAVVRLWREVRSETGDPCIGLYTARCLRPQALHALGLSWLASRTVFDGFSRLARYAHIANTGLHLRLVDVGEQFKVVPEVDAGGLEPTQEALDSILAFIVKMCRLITDSNFAPLLVTFRHPDNGHADQYIDYFQAPVFFSRNEDALYFDAEVIKRPVPAGNEALAIETDRIAERYLATLNPDRVQDRVREILLTLLPSGEADQQAVARSLHRSVSSLQRQLKSEGATYRRVLDETRRTLAQQLMQEERYSLGQIAYLLGFSDQANFSRAFRRWTGYAPTEFRSQ